jgi:hypothetical protein
MNTSKTFTSYTEAQAFYNAQTGDCSLASSKQHGWVVQYTEKATKIDQVYQALKANIENNNMVCLDNINLTTLGITPKQFSGYCSQLQQQGKYYTQDDWNGWAEVK